MNSTVTFIFEAVDSGVVDAMMVAGNPGKSSRPVPLQGCGLLRPNARWFEWACGLDVETISDFGSGSLFCQALGKQRIQSAQPHGAWQGSASSLHLHAQNHDDEEKGPIQEALEPVMIGPHSCTRLIDAARISSCRYATKVARGGSACP